MIQFVVPDKPPLRRRIPTVIRRRYLGFQHAEHQIIKVMCRHSESYETSAQSENRDREFNGAANNSKDRCPVIRLDAVDKVRS